MTRTFLTAVNAILDTRGGYVRDPESNWGITKAAYPDLPVALLSRDDAVSIYWRDWPTLVGGERPE